MPVGLERNKHAVDEMSDGLYIPVEIFLTESEASRPVQNSFWLPFCAKSRRWVLPSCKDLPLARFSCQFWMILGLWYPLVPTILSGYSMTTNWTGSNGGLIMVKYGPYNLDGSKKSRSNDSELGIFQRFLHLEETPVFASATPKQSENDLSAPCVFMVSLVLTIL